MWLKYAACIFSFLIVSTVYPQGTASSNVHIFEIHSPQLNTLRTIRVYFPEGYEASTEHFPVLYMHDAQNLFDTTTAFSGEWKIDEFFDTQKGQKIIVVGIDHGNKNRISELTPFANEKYGGGEANAYVEFITKTLKPHVDSTLRTLPEVANTTIMGSSLGGLVSFYAALKYSEVFGKAGVFSPSFWYSEKIYDFAEASEVNEEFKIYFVGGTSEGPAMVPDLKKMEELLLKKGLPRGNLKVKIVAGGEHNEAFWSREFPEAFEWLFKGETKAE